MSAYISTIVVDDWYDSPDQIRKHAIKCLENGGTEGKSKVFVEHMREHGNKWEPYPGWRCKAAVGNMLWNYDMISRVIGCKIDPKRWLFIPSTEVVTGDMQNYLQYDYKKNTMIVRDTDIQFSHDVVSNGTFACTFEDSIWRAHTDSPNSYAAIVYLTPDAPIDTGTSFYRHRETGVTESQSEIDTINKEDFFDPTMWEETDRIANYYNRCVIFDASRYHCASRYFGEPSNFDKGRIFQVFFFDLVDGEGEA
jgi:hypothetical protein